MVASLFRSEREANNASATHGIPRTWKHSLDIPKQRKMDTRLETWNVRSVYSLGQSRLIKQRKKTISEIESVRVQAYQWTSRRFGQETTFL